MSPRRAISVAAVAVSLVLAASARAQFSGLRADAESDPCAAAPTHDAALSCVREGVTSLSRAVAAKDAPEIARLADSVRRGSEAARHASESLPEKERGDGYLLGVERAAWELAEAARSGKTGEYTERYDALARSARPIGDALRAPDLGELIVRARVAVDAVASESERADAKSCLDTIKIPDIAAGLKAGRYTDTEKRLINDRVAGDLMHWYQHMSYQTDDPKLCAQSSVVEGMFMNRSSNASKSGGWTCREWNNEKSFTYALITRGPGLEEHCRRYMAFAYPDMSESGRVKACAIISKNYDDPKTLCAKLVPDQIAPEKLPACLSEFQRYRPNDPDKVCGELKGGMPYWQERCRSLTAFANAYTRKDPSLCGNHELCRLYMNDWAPYGRRYEAKIKTAMCAIPADAKTADAARARGLLETASGLAARQPSRLKTVDALRRRMALLTASAR